jgi:GMP synthase-like glutamine amidotransferase
MAIVVFEHSSIAGIDRLGRTLRGYGHRLKVISVDRGGEIPVDLDDVDGVVACGGGQSANDDSLPWLEAELEYTLPVLGICLGSQLLARALGGTVGTLEGGPEIGWHDVILSDVGREDPLHAGLPWTMSQLHWHEEHVTKVPPGARVLAKSNRTPVQAWAAGLRTYAVQYHPEVSAASIERFAADDRDGLSRAGGSPEQLRAETAKRYPAFERLTQRFFESVALLLMPADRLVRGVARDLHH